MKKTVKEIAQTKKNHTMTTTMKNLNVFLQNIFPQTVRFGVLSWKKGTRRVEWHADRSWWPADRMGGTRIGAGGPRLDGTQVARKTRWVAVARVARGSKLGPAGADGGQMGGTGAGGPPLLSSG